ncbi:Uncharacterized protein APZ42_033148 [Daphnia magna]|uniref:Uncharacterized protein n=1 Tax=Daphnia magna TaxID=35525 RepID=A0A164LE55_9CRUS|nr:Uncharacterized protein APZ42_033148 [Daphnia magna]
MFSHVSVLPRLRKLKKKKNVHHNLYQFTATENSLRTRLIVLEYRTKKITVQYNLISFVRQ